VVGFLLSESAKKGVIGSTNVGVVIAMAIGAALYALLTFVLKLDPKPRVAGTSERDLAELAS
jgi:hypothetical protein